MKNSKIIILLSVLIMLMFIVPSSFAADLDGAVMNQDLEISDSNADVIEEFNSDSDLITSDSDGIDDSEFSSDSNLIDDSSDGYQVIDNDSKAIKKNLESKSVSSGVNVDEGISVDYDNLTMITPKSAYINGTVYCTGAYPGKPFPGALNLSYSYVGDDGLTHAANFLLGSNGAFSLDITFFPNLSPRDDPYIFTIGCPDTRYLNLWDNTEMPESVDVYVYVVQGSALPVENNTIYVATDGSDLDGSGHIDYPLRTIQKAAELAAQMKQNCTIVLKEGVHTVDYIVNNSAKYDLNIVGLENALVDFAHSSYGFELGGTVYISNITFFNAYGPRSPNYAPIKMSSTAGKLLSIDNCNFINCTGNWAGAVSTYYGGTGVLRVNNSNFINCVGTSGGAIAVSYAKFADIAYSTFINCSSTYGAVAIHTTTGGMNQTKINYCVFSNNYGTNVSDVFTKKAENLEYNFWGTNQKPNASAVSEISPINYWVPLVIDADLSRVVINKNIDFSFDLTKYTDGENLYSLDNPIPDIEISMAADLGTFSDNPVRTENGHANSTYSSSETGSETIIFNTPGATDELKFDIIGDDLSVIYVSPDGSDVTGNGTEGLPFATIAHALSQVTDTRNTIYIKKGTYKEHDLLIDKSLTIIGESLEETIVDAENSGRIFIISAYNKNIDIKTITLINGRPDFENEGYDDDLFKQGKGGAIYIDEGNLKLNATIIANSSSAAGGAVASGAGAAGSLTILDSIFEGNSITQDAYDEGYFEILGGGAIYSDSTLRITNSSFIDNTALSIDGNDEGGAIYIGAAAYINDSTFAGNTAKDGGAIYISASNRDEVSVINNEFNLNTAYNGGAIYSGMSAITMITANTFEENNANANGGAIYAFGKTTVDSVRDNAFINNHANNGGAIASRFANIRVSNNTMESNSANTMGDYIYLDSAFMNVNLTFIGNDTLSVNHNDNASLFALLTDDMGNPIANAKINFTLDDEFIATGITGNDGIATVNYQTNDTLSNYTVSGIFEGSSTSYPATIKTGVLEVTKFYWFIGSQGYITLQDAVDGSVEGDVIIGLPGTYAYEEVYIGNRMEHIYKNVTIKAENLGDIILTGLNGKLFNVAAQFYGDYNHRPSLLRLENIIVENSTDEYGGAIYNDGFFEADNCIFRNNRETNTDTSSKWHGGAIMNWRDMKINNCTFVNNSGTSGGAINTEALTGTVVITNCIFKDNFVYDTGGAIYAAGYSGNYLILENCSFINNTAGANLEDGSGGALFTDANTTMKNCDFVNNTATIAGGAVYSSDYFTADNITVEGSSAQWGGAFFMVQSYTTFSSSTTSGEVEITEIIETYNLTNSVFKNNHASLYGGTIFEGEFRLSTGFVDNCTFINSSAVEYGGAISNHASNCTVSNSRFINISSGNGGSLYNLGTTVFDGYSEVTYVGNLMVYNCEFNNTKSELNGGAISNDNESAYLVVENCVFDTSEAGGYGGVIFNNGILNLKNNTMKNADAETGDYIYNNFSASRVYLKFLNAETVYYSLNENPVYKLFVNVTDDMGNPISGMKVLFTIDEVSTGTLCDVVEGIANYDFSIPSIGEYVIDGRYSGSSEGVYLTEEGILSVTVRNSTHLEVNLNSTLYVGDNLTVKLVDENGSPLSNKSVSIVLTHNGAGTTLNKSTDENGEIIIPELNVGNYNIKASFLGDDYYLESDYENTFTVNKINTFIQFALNDTELSIKLIDDDNGPITSKALVISIIDGKGQTSYRYETTNAEGLVLLNFAKGSYLVKAEFAGNEIYNGTENLTQFEIKANGVFLDLKHDSIYAKQSFNLEITLLDENALPLNGTVILNFNGENKSVVIEEGKATVRMDPIDVAGVYPLILSYLGDEEHDSVEASFDINVLNASDIPTNFSADTIQKLIDNANPGDTISLGNYHYYNVSDVNITKNITIDGTGATIISAGNNKPIFNILPVSEGVENVTIQGANIQVNNCDIVVLAIAENDTRPYYIEVPEISIANNLISTADDSVVAGSITVLVLNSERGILAPTNQIMVSGNTIDAGMNPFVFNVTTVANGANATVPIMELVKKATVIEYEDMTTTAIDSSIEPGTGKYFKITLKDSDGKTLANKAVQFGFNGKIYNKTTNDQGVAELQINLQRADIYTFAVSFQGDDAYNGSFAVAKITVKKQTPSLTVPNKSYKASAKTKTLTATFKSASGKVVAGKKVSFTVNGKTYTATTDAKGVASVNVSLSDKKTYSFTAKFAGDNTYAAVSVSKKLTLT